MLKSCTVLDYAIFGRQVPSLRPVKLFNVFASVANLCLSAVLCHVIIDRSTFSRTTLVHCFKVSGNIFASYINLLLSVDKKVSGQMN